MRQSPPAFGPVVMALVVVGALAGLSASAAGQGFFDFFALRGRPAPPPHAYADPRFDPYERRYRTGPPRYWQDDDFDEDEFDGPPPSRRRPATPARPDNTGREAAFCVRLCDGRYFPIAGARPDAAANLCNAFCPASPSKVFSGREIASATAEDGKTYSGLPNAFVYRDRLVPGCTCNGRDAFGLARVDLDDDPTLRAGDVVATPEGLKAYSERKAGRGAYTPVGKAENLSRELRAKLARIPVAGAR